MIPEVSDALVERVARALGDAPTAAFTTPVVYPWSVRHFEPRPGAERGRPHGDAHGLYIHIPFCRYHCSFCFYAVRGGARRAEMERYVAALRRELDWLAPGTRLTRLVIGGGTPTALPPELLDAVYGAVAERAELPPPGRCKIEASPDSISAEHVDVLAARGVGWVSLGMESLDADVLDAVHRGHSPDQALAACQLVLDAGCKLNVDLIYGLPGQSRAGWLADLQVAAATGAHSLCLYALRLNERTSVARQLGQDEHLDLAQLMRWRAFVDEAAGTLGFEQSRGYTWLRRDGRARWQDRAPGSAAETERNLLGVGMSARSQLAGVAYRNEDRFDRYLERVETGNSPVTSLFELDAGDRQTQFVARTLGSLEPLDRAVWEATFGEPIDVGHHETLERLTRGGLIEDDGARIALTDTGRLVYDRVLLCFYPPRARAWLAAGTARA